MTGKKIAGSWRRRCDHIIQLTLLVLIAGFERLVHLITLVFKSR